MPNDSALKIISDDRPLGQSEVNSRIDETNTISNNKPINQKSRDDLLAWLRRYGWCVLANKLTSKNSLRHYTLHPGFMEGKSC